MKETSFFLPLKALYEDPSFTEGTRTSFGDQQIYKFMMVDIANQIPSVQLSVYDGMVNESLDMVAQIMMADDAVTSDEAFDTYMEDLQYKVPDVTVR